MPGADPAALNPATLPSVLGTLAPGVHVVGGMGNALTVEIDEGVLQVDTGQSPKQASQMLARLRGITDAPVHAIVYSHGHLGYNNAVGTWLEDARRRGDRMPRVLAHENLLRRWRRYRETEGLQKLFVELQLRIPVGRFERDLQLRLPDETFSDSLHFTSKGRRVNVLWAPSETDDAVVVWLPEERLLYGGAAITPSIPNVGTPLRSLRDPVRWADTLDRLADLAPATVVMEFGPALEGEEKIQKILRSTAEALRWVRREVVERMNRGLGIEEILHDIAFPAELFDQPWMRPLYGHPDYIVRDVFRAENGWWDRNPTSLHPALPAAAAAAILSAVTDRRAVLERARELAAAGEHQLALHVVDLLALAPGDDPELTEARALKADLCRTLADAAQSFVSQSLYRSSSEIIRGGAPKPTGVR
jgi:uncharacterized sulfatase